MRFSSWVGLLVFVIGAASLALLAHVIVFMYTGPIGSLVALGLAVVAMVLVLWRSGDDAGLESEVA